MKNKKGLSNTMVTIIIIILLALVTVGIVWIYIQNILEPQFKITKEECVKEIDSMLQDAYLGCIIGCNFLDNISLVVECNDYCGEKIVYKEEVCEPIEVDEIWFWHEELTNTIDEKAKIQGYEVVEDKALTIGWLNNNCDWIFDGDGTLVKYGCQDYIVEVLN